MGYQGGTEGGASSNCLEVGVLKD